LGQVVGRALLEAFAEALMKKMTKESQRTCSETRRLQDEDAAVEAQAMERWLNDGGTQDSPPDGGSPIDDDVLNRFHTWRPQARADAGKSAPAFAKHSSNVARALARALKR
jgi:hypothetical protein